MTEAMNSPFFEKKISSTRMYTGNYIAVNHDEVQLPNDRRATRDVVLHPGAVTILAVTEDERVVLVRQFRYAIGQETVELPAGKLDPHEKPLDAAIRELGEETGYMAASVTLLHTFYSAPGFCDEKMYLYEARGLTLGEIHPDEDEFLAPILLSKHEAKEWVANGKITDAKTLIGLLHFLST